MKQILQLMKYDFISPKEINDAYSAKVFDLLLKRLDPNKRFFLAEDIERFNLHRYALDDEAKEGNFAFFELTETVLSKRVDSFCLFFSDYLERPLDFNIDEAIETDADKLGYAKNELELKQEWERFLKFQLLIRIRQSYRNYEKSNNLSWAEIEKKEREKWLKTMHTWAEKRKDETRSVRFANYLNTFLQAMDVHSGYFPPAGDDNFNVRNSEKLEGIGLQLVKVNDYFRVENIIPGSAADLQGDLSLNDIIISIGQGDDEQVDIYGWSMEDVLSLIRGKKKTEVRLTVKKVSGVINQISITRNEVMLEEDYVQSALITDDKINVKVGLIDLPSFYADFGNLDGRRCYKDIQAELKKLGEKNIDGLVIDLRFNRGGSLTDMLEIAGMFLPNKPVLQVKSGSSLPYVMKSNQPKLIYDGPLIILVNSYTASVAEILAASLQDYGRAIIAGTSPSTRGEGTVQRFSQLDAITPPEFKYLGALGSIKLTLQEYYRVSGGAIELRGVIPDIILPNPYMYLTEGEETKENPKAWPGIESISYQPGGEVSALLPEIKKKSSKRVAADHGFSLLEAQGRWIRTQGENTRYPLKFSEYDKFCKTLETEAKKYFKTNGGWPSLNIEPLPTDAELITDDTQLENKRKRWHSSLKEDTYLNELLHLIKDWKKSRPG